MVRKYYKRKIYKRKVKYASNIMDIGPSTFVLNNTEGWNAVDLTLVTNPAQDYNSSSSIKTIKNVDVTLEAESSGSWEGIESIQFYIMYLPEDMTISENFPLKHPEYIMACKFYGSPQPEYNDTINLKQPARIKTRLSRNLNTGDKIILFIRAANTTSTVKNVLYQGLVRWWTKDN